MVDLASHRLVFELETRGLSPNLIWSVFQHLENRRKSLVLLKLCKFQEPGSRIKRNLVKFPLAERPVLVYGIYSQSWAAGPEEQT